MLFDAEQICKYVDEYSMINRKRSVEVQQYVSWRAACVLRLYDIVVGDDDSGLGRLMLSVGWFMHWKTILVRMYSQMVQYQPFDGFWDKAEKYFQAWKLFNA